MGKGETTTPHTALYRKYRPRSLDEFAGQSQVSNVLVRSLAQGKIAHAYLLTGPKGVGKTSIARIMAHHINKLPYDDEATHLDIIEIDAASNNGVEDVRDLRDRVQIAPIAAAKKIYIIDEVHMLSKAAFNALLKTLEEPPAHVVFILATTDLHKVPATIISRTQHFSLHAISPADLTTQLKKIAKGEGIKISDDAINAIAERGDGSYRNSISLLDQMSSFADDKEGITLELVQATLGLAPDDAVNTLLAAVDEHDVASVIGTLNLLEEQGIQPVILTDQIIRTLRDRLAERPQYVTLLDSLLVISSSPQPQLKLLTTLVGSIKPASVPRAVATRATKPIPKVLEAPVIVIEKEVPAATIEKNEEVTTVIEQSKTETAAPKPVKKKGSAEPINWDALLEYTKKSAVALYSVLNKCEYEQSGDELTLYTVRKFNKTKLDESKYQVQLQQAFEHIGQPTLTIITIPTHKPPTDEKLAAVAAIMGGGKEVSVEEMENNG
jgi:DNA polymerase-3 subunit gamma/tau